MRNSCCRTHSSPPGCLVLRLKASPMFCFRLTTMTLLADCRTHGQRISAIIVSTRFPNTWRIVQARTLSRQLAMDTRLCFRWGMGCRSIPICLTITISIQARLSSIRAITVVASISRTKAQRQNRSNSSATLLQTTSLY